MPIKSILAVVILYSNFLYAGVPPLELIEEVLREEFSGNYSLISEMRVSPEIVYELKEDKSYYNEKYELTVENGKIYSSRQEFRPEGLSVQNKSWNGRIAYGAFSPDSNKSGQNSISSEFSLGTHGIVLNKYFSLGIMPDMIIGSLDPSHPRSMAMVYNPLRVIDRVKQEEITGVTSKIFLEETTYKGRNLTKMSLRAVVKPFMTLWPGPIVEHVLDPEFSYRAVETRRYTNTGLIESMTRNYSRDNAGNIILVSAESRYRVRIHNGANIYPEEDLDKVSVIRRYEFDTYKVNEDVDPAVYESENVFIPGLETWDRDRKVIVEDSLEEIQRETLLNLGRHLLAENSEETSQFESDSIEISEATYSQELKGDPLEKDHLVEAVTEKKNNTAAVSKGAYGLWVLFGAISIVLVLVFRKTRQRTIALSLMGILFINTDISLANQEIGTQKTHHGIVSVIQDNIHLGIVPVLQDEVAYQYKLRNSHNRPMHIKKLKPKCSCAVTKYPEVIAPGATGILDISLSTIGKIGKFATSIWIWTDLSKKPLEVGISCYKQSIQMTEQVIFGDSDLAGNLKNTSRSIVVRMFDDYKLPITLGNLVYDKNILAITASDYSQKNFQLKENGKTWSYQEKVFFVSEIPKNIDAGSYIKHVTIKGLPLLKTKDDVGNPVFPSLGTRVHGRVLEDLYTKPTSLTFLISKTASKDKPWMHKKNFSLFKSEGINFEFDFNKEILQISDKGKDRHEVVLLLGDRDINSIEESIRISYKQKDSKKTGIFTLPVKILTY